jgi:hypothetical protein
VKHDSSSFAPLELLPAVFTERTPPLAPDVPPACCVGDSACDGHELAIGPLSAPQLSGEDVLHAQRGQALSRKGCMREFSMRLAHLPRVDHVCARTTSQQTQLWC